jgi:hypothetical protein
MKPLCFVRLRRFERLTYSSGGCRSIQLSYRRMSKYDNKIRNNAGQGNRRAPRPLTVNAVTIGEKNRELKEESAPSPHIRKNGDRSKLDPGTVDIFPNHGQVKNNKPEKAVHSLLRRNRRHSRSQPTPQSSTTRARLVPPETPIHFKRPTESFPTRESILSVSLATN